METLETRGGEERAGEEAAEIKKTSGEREVAGVVLLRGIEEKKVRKIFFIFLYKRVAFSS